LVGVLSFDASSFFLPAIGQQLGKCLISPAVEPPFLATFVPHFPKNDLLTDLKILTTYDSVHFASCPHLHSRNSVANLMHQNYN